MGCHVPGCPVVPRVQDAHRGSPVGGGGQVKAAGGGCHGRGHRRQPQQGWATEDVVVAYAGDATSAATVVCSLCQKRSKAAAAARTPAASPRCCQGGEAGAASMHGVGDVSRHFPSWEWVVRPKATECVRGAMPRPSGRGASPTTGRIRRVGEGRGCPGSTRPLLLPPRSRGVLPHRRPRAGAGVGDCRRRCRPPSGLHPLPSSRQRDDHGINGPATAALSNPPLCSIRPPLLHSVGARHESPGDQASANRSRSTCGVGSVGSSPRREDRHGQRDFEECVARRAAK